MARILARPDSQNRLLLAGAIGLAVLAAALAFGSLRALDGGGGGTSAGPALDVVVATRRIEAGERISDDMLSVVSLQSDGIIGNALTTRDGLTGLIVRYPLEQGEQLTGGKLGQRPIGEASPLSDVVPPGKRAVTVEVTEQKVFGGLLAPGDHVDVIAIVEVIVDGLDVAEARQLVQNAEVLAVADQPLRAVARNDRDGTPIESETADGTLGARPDDVEAQPKANSITLAVNPEDALIIALAQERWSVWLSLRGTGDTDILQIAPRELE